MAEAALTVKPASKRNTPKKSTPDRVISFSAELMVVQFATVIGITAGRGLSSKQIPQRSKSGVFSAVCLEFRI